MPTALLVLSLNMKLSYMVNNARTARVCLTTLLLILSFNYLSAQKISKYYNSRHQENGTLYFILEQDGFKNSISSFFYDLTYLTSSDSVTFNFSVITKDDISIDSIKLFNNENNMTSVSTRLFVESKKEKWIYRYSSKFLFKDLEIFYNEGTPYINLFSKNNTIKLTIKQNKWDEQCAIIKKIFTLINHNR
jgi:hypothetical protein